MSGGYFDYAQYNLDRIADELEQRIIDEREKTPLKFILGLSEETLKEFEIGLFLVRQAAIYAQRIDWLLSGDDGEETFHERLKSDLGKL